MSGRLPATIGLEGGGNKLLAAMAPGDLQFLAGRSSRRVFGLDEVLHQTSQVARNVYFVEHGIASVARLDASGRRTEICLIGPEGFTGASVLLDDGRQPYEIYSQSGMLCTVQVAADELRALADRSADARRILECALFAQMTQISDNLVSAVRQSVAPRLARWLLLYRERLRSDRIEVTHAYMAVMIGYQRTKVTGALHELEASGAIAASRGLVLVTDAAMLRTIASRGLDEPEHDADASGVA